MPVETVPGQSQGIAPKLSILTIPITAPEATLTTPHQILVGSSPNQSPKQARRFVITNISRTVNESPTMIEPLGFKNTSPRPTQRSEADFDTDCSTGTSPENSIFNFTDQHSNEEEPRIAAPTFSENETDYQPQSFPSIESEHSNSLRSFSPSELNTTQLEDLPGYSTSDSSIASSRFDKASFEDVRETVSEPALESSKTTSRPIQESRHLSPIGELVPESNPKAPPSSMESKHNPLFYISSSESERSTEEMSSEIGSNESSGSLSDEFPATPLPSPEPQFTVPRVSMFPEPPAQQLMNDLSRPANLSHQPIFANKFLGSSYTAMTSDRNQLSLDRLQVSPEAPTKIINNHRIDYWLATQKKVPLIPSSPPPSWLDIAIQLERQNAPASSHDFYASEYQTRIGVFNVQPASCSSQYTTAPNPLHFGQHPIYQRASTTTPGLAQAPTRVFQFGGYNGTSNLAQHSIYQPRSDNETSGSPSALRFKHQSISRPVNKHVSQSNHVGFILPRAHPLTVMDKFELSLLNYKTPSMEHIENLVIPVLEDAIPKIDYWNDEGYH
ncbi:unnamed protein product [Caenorhabditis bovis]|nr:unnamed protein product [Caenorhabditis bovis]